MHRGRAHTVNYWLKHPVNWTVFLSERPQQQRLRPTVKAHWLVKRKRHWMRAEEMWGGVAVKRRRLGRARLVRKGKPYAALAWVCWGLEGGGEEARGQTN